MLTWGRVTLAIVVATSASVIRECVELNGASYSGVMKISSSGETCLNWVNTSRSYNLTIDLGTNPGQWDHNYCRNPDTSSRPWCFVLAENGIQRQDCFIDACRDQTPEVGSEANKTKAKTETETETEAASSGQGQTDPRSVHPPRGSDAVKLDPGINRRVSLRPGQKKDLGALGYALGGVLMAVIVLLGTGITIGYIYRKGVKLRMQQEQRAYEQEMHRIDLPLSAFTNPACDITDEQPGEREEEGGLTEREKPAEIQMNTFKTRTETRSEKEG